MSARVLHLHSGNLFGGIETMLLTVAAPRQGQLSPRVRVALCFAGRLADELTERGVAVEMLGPVRLSRPATLRRARACLRRLLAAWRPDLVVVHLPWTLAAFGSTLEAHGVRVLQWVHGPLTGLLQWWGSRTPPDSLICNSAYTRTQVPPAYHSLPIAVIHYPVPAATPPSAECRQQTRASLGASDTDVIIVQASRFEPWKGHASHLRALAQLVDVAGWRLWIVAGAQRPEEARYQRAIMQLTTDLGLGERVRFTGEQTDVHRYLSAADLYCQPNTGPEPFGLAYVEALASGLPVVATNMGAAPEIVTPATGVLVPAGDDPALADALRGLIVDRVRRSAMRRAAPVRALELCDPQRQLARIDDYLAAVAVAGTGSA